MINNIVRYLSEYKIDWIFSGDNDRSRLFLKELYLRINMPIFEYSCYEVLLYQTFKGPFVFFEFGHCMIPLHIRDTSVVLFTPFISDKETLVFLKKLFERLHLKHMQVSIVSHPWLQEWEPTLLHVFGRNNVAVSYRAENEAVYSIEALTKLEGANFATLRRVKNKIIETNQINFQTLTETTLEHGEGVLKVWHDTQGKIYEGPSRYQKELYALKSFWQNSITDKNIFIRLGYYYDLPVALTVFYINPVLTEWGVNFMIKSKTRKYFQDLPHGIADAAYLDMFKQLHDRNVAFLNDGELGTEEGTRHHKLSRFRPIEFLKSYNIDITL